MPIAIQIIFTAIDLPVVKLDAGMVITVAAITIPIMPWNAIE